jgi:hypothetical protein
MATKVIRTCDRLGCAIDAVPFDAGADLPSMETVGYTVLKTVTSKSGKTTTSTLVDFDEVCETCSEAIEDLVLRIKGEKRVGRPRKVEASKTPSEDVVTAEAKEPPKTRKKPGPKPGSKRRGRRSKAQIEADRIAAAAAVDEPVEIPETLDPDADDVLKSAVHAALMANAKISSEAESTEEEQDLDTFETDDGEVVNADTGEVIASPVEVEDDEEDVAVTAPSNGVEMHPF